MQKGPVQWLAHPLSHIPVNLLQGASSLQWPRQSAHDLFDMNFPFGHTVINPHFFFISQVSKKCNKCIHRFELIYTPCNTISSAFYHKHWKFKLNWINNRNTKSKVIYLALFLCGKSGTCMYAIFTETKHCQNTLPPKKNPQKNPTIFKLKYYMCYRRFRKKTHKNIRLFIFIDISYLLSWYWFQSILYVSLALWKILTAINLD